MVKDEKQRKEEKQLTEFEDVMKTIFPELFEDPRLDEKKGENPQSPTDMNAFIRRGR